MPVAYHRKVLEALPIELNSDQFVFDNQILAQIIYAGYLIGEVTCQTLYMDDSSSINLANSIIYGLAVLKTSFIFRLNAWGWISSPFFLKKVASNHAMEAPYFESQHHLA
jgi:hypothetical protein